MEQEHPSLNHFAMIHGLYLGLALILNQLIFYIAGNPFSDVKEFITWPILIAGAGYAMWSFARLNSEEGLPYSRAMGLGTLVTFLGAILYALFTYFLYKFIEPGLMDKFLATMEEKLLTQGYKDDFIEKILNAQKNFMTPGVLSVSLVFSVTLMGFIFSLVLAIFLKKEPEDPFYGVDQEEEEYE